MIVLNKSRAAKNSRSYLTSLKPSNDNDKSKCKLSDKTENEFKVFKNNYSNQVLSK